MNAASPTLGENMFVPALTTVFLGATYGKIGVINIGRRSTLRIDQSGIIDDHR